MTQMEFIQAIVKYGVTNILLGFVIFQMMVLLKYLIQNVVSSLNNIAVTLDKQQSVLDKQSVLLDSLLAKGGVSSE